MRTPAISFFDKGGVPEPLQEERNKAEATAITRKKPLKFILLGFFVLLILLVIKRRHILGQFLVLEQDDIEHRSGYERIGQIEYRSEEHKRVSCPRSPIGPSGLDDRKIEHVDDLAEEKVTAIEDHTIENAVDEIAQSASKDEDPSPDKATRKTSADDIIDEITKSDNSKQSEQRKEHLAAKSNAKSHAVVLDKTKVEPLEDLDIGAVADVDANSILDKLVGHNEQQSHN